MSIMAVAPRSAACGPASYGGAVELDLDGIPGLRRDVDTPDDLRGAVALGLGPRSAPLAAELLRCAPRGR
jgi:2-phospho-L-lactate guanylyltransferase